MNNIAAAKTAVGSSVDSREEAPEKVCIDSDSDDEDDELINNNPISSIQQLKAADEEAGKQNSRQQVRNGVCMEILFLMISGECYTQSFKKNVNLIWWRI